MIDFKIRPANDEDLITLPYIEDAASLRFDALDMPKTDGMANITIEEYRQFKYIFVAENATNAQLCGFVAIGEKDQQAYIEEISVHPDFGRQGIGRNLMLSAIDWAKDSGYDFMYLTTYADILFNAPFYRKLGFTTLSETEMGGDLAKTRAHEKALGLDQTPRIAMSLKMS